MYVQMYQENVLEPVNGAISISTLIISGCSFNFSATATNQNQFPGGFALFKISDSNSIEGETCSSRLKKPHQLLVPPCRHQGFVSPCVEVLTGLNGLSGIFVVQEAFDDDNIVDMTLKSLLIKLLMMLIRIR